MDHTSLILTCLFVEVLWHLIYSSTMTSIPALHRCITVHLGLYKVREEIQLFYMVINNMSRTQKSI